MSEKSWTVGRGPGVDIVLADEYVSPRHARFYRDEADQAWVEELGSTNGTWVNGTIRYGPTMIYPGDTVRIGHTNMPWHL